MELTNREATALSYKIIHYGLLAGAVMGAILSFMFKFEDYNASFTVPEFIFWGVYGLFIFIGSEFFTVMDHLDQFNKKRSKQKQKLEIGFAKFDGLIASFLMIGVFMFVMKLLIFILILIFKWLFENIILNLKGFFTVVGIIALVLLLFYWWVSINQHYLNKTFKFKKEDRIKRVLQIKK